MALYQCPLCGGLDSRLFHSVSHAPKQHLVDRGYVVSALDFAPLQVVNCTGCGHLYNLAFDAEEAEQIYVHSQVTNAPVSPGMIAAVAQSAEKIISACPSAKRMLEVGGGSGALSAAIASRGLEVVMLEPNRHLDVKALSAQGVTLLADMFPSDRLAGTFDLIVCRQVLEHVPDPVAFIDALGGVLAADGIVYLEVPSADYILVNCSLVDFHFPHIQYFRGQVITRWLEQRGYMVSETVSIKDGHDAGYFLRRNHGRRGALDGHHRNPQSDAYPRSLASNFAAPRAKAAARLAHAPKPIALYGATAYAQAFLGTWPDVVGVDRVFDDTQGYWQSCAYGPKGSVPIMRCDGATLSGVGTVIITAYLHDLEIFRKLRAEGFGGAVFTLRSSAANPAQAELASLI